MERVCKKCNELKDLTEFCKDKACNLGYSGTCKACRNIYWKDWVVKNPDKFKTVQKKSYEKNKDKRLAFHSKYRKRNREWISEKRIKAKHRDYEGYKNYFKKYKNENRERLIPYRREYTRYKRKTDITFRIKNSLRAEIQRTLRRVNTTKKDRVIELVGCSLSFLKNYLEERFLPTMTWENYGKYWHIDHIIPCSKFNLTKREEQLKCFNYKNLQPLFAITQIIDGIEYIGNLNKNNKILENECRKL